MSDRKNAEAILAAAKATWAESHSDTWEEADDQDRRVYLADARATLETAAALGLTTREPHTTIPLAEAWDEGHGAGWNDCLLDMQKRGTVSSNPYRIQNG